MSATSTKTGVPTSTILKYGKFSYCPLFHGIDADPREWQCWGGARGATGCLKSNWGGRFLPLFAGFKFLQSAASRHSSCNSSCHESSILVVRKPAFFVSQGQCFHHQLQVFMQSWLQDHLMCGWTSFFDCENLNQVFRLYDSRETCFACTPICVFMGALAEKQLLGEKRNEDIYLVLLTRL